MTDQAVDLVTIPRTEYDALRERIADLEDVVAILEARLDGGETIPFAMAEAMLDGKPPLTAWREHRGLTQRALADKAGISTGMMNDIEKGRRTPSLPTARGLAKVLGVDIDDLFGEMAG